jgi:hypothetical protein
VLDQLLAVQPSLTTSRVVTAISPFGLSERRGLLTTDTIGGAETLQPGGVTFGAPRACTPIGAHG